MFTNFMYKIHHKALSSNFLSKTFYMYNLTCMISEVNTALLNNRAQTFKEGVERLECITYQNLELYQL